jgi:hypothetical protein
MNHEYGPRAKKWGRKLKAITVEVLPGEQILLKQLQDEIKAATGKKPAKGQLVSQALQAQHKSYRKGYKQLIKDREEQEKEANKPVSENEL